MYMTSREFNQDLAKAKRHSLENPVVITDRGKPKHVLMSFVAFEKFVQLASLKPSRTLFDCFAEGSADAADIGLAIPTRSRVQRSLVRFDTEQK